MYKQLIGIGTNEASVNIAAASMKGRIENEVPWILLMRVLTV